MRAHGRKRYENGTGKTTLLKYLLLEGDKVQHAKFVRIGYYDQENADLDPEDRVLDAFWGKNSLMTQTTACSMPFGARTAS